jgi:hypothetical protein
LFPWISSDLLLRLAFPLATAYHESMKSKGERMNKICVSILCGILLGPAAFVSAQGPGPDPSGVWESGIGSLSLMLAGNELAFSYTAVFGPTAHICEGTGIARRVADGSFVYQDDQGSVIFLVTEDEIRLQPGDGIIGFCGANWPGDAFKRDKFKPAASCRVTAARAYFHAVGPIPPLQGRAYVISGDLVETIPLQETLAKDWVLARFKGPKSITAGCLRRTDLSCEKK